MITNCNLIQTGLLGAVLLALPAVAQAQFNYTTNDGAVTITQYTGSGGDVIIPDTIDDLPVTSVGPDAFYQSFSLTSVTMGTNLVSVGENAIFQCINLASVTMLGVVTNFGSGPFIDCQSLTEISLSPSNSFYTVTNDLLFNKKLTSLIEFPGGVGGSYTLPTAVTNVDEAFIGNTLTSIAVDAANLYYSGTNGVLFNKNKSTLIEYPGGLTGSYTVPRSVTSIASAAFEFSIGVGSVTIGAPVTSIGLYAFYDCTNMTEISVSETNVDFSSTNGVLFNKKQTMLIQYPSGLPGSYIVASTVTNIGVGAFGDAFGLTDVVIPDSVLSVGEEGFYACEGLTNVIIGDSVTSIEQNTFYECLSLNAVTIPNSVTNIGQFAFYYCPNLTSVTIGSGVVSIAGEAFAYCDILTNACFEGNEPSDGGGIFFSDYSLPTISYVNGTSGWGATYDGIVTAPCTECAGVPSLLLSIIASGANVILTWPVYYSGFTLQSTTSLAFPEVWGTVSPPAVIVNGVYTVTNSISGTPTFYRLVSP